ncbi:MAG: glycosyltransferase family 1 protein [Thermoleophilaceae bacterium]|nr:glycosyltransferase family 1 protein [Thermoleophilaceae bacterium]
MRVLFASTRGAGHFNPLVPFIEACVRGGHEVMVAGPPSLAETVERAGYRFWPGEAPPEDELGAVWARVPTVSREEAEAIVIGEIFAGFNVRAMLPRLRVACAEWQPHLLLREPAEFASALAAELQEVPHARIGVSLAASEELAFALAGPALEEQLPGVTDRIRSSPYLTLFPASLEDPEASRPELTHRFRDPAARTSADALPDWWPGDSRPLVYISFGSVTGSMPMAGRLYEGALEAAAELPARVLLTVGRDTDTGALGPAPANVRVEPWVAQADVFRHASLVVSHGGSGTTLGALAAGLPLVVVPLFADQPDNARRVAAVGAGIAVWPDPDAAPEPIRSSVDPAALREAVVNVLGEPAYAHGAGRLAAEMASLPPTDSALDAAAPTNVR